MPANPEIVILLRKDLYSVLYRQWEQNIKGMKPRTLVSLRLQLLLRVGMLHREHLAATANGSDIPGQTKRVSRRRKARICRSFYSIRCRVDPRIYPDVLDEWRALARGTRSIIFAEYLRIGLQMKPEEIRDAAQKLAKNIVWQPHGASPSRTEPGAGTPSARVESHILADPGKIDNIAARLADNFLNPED